MKYALIKSGKIDNIIIADYTAANMLAQDLGYDAAINCDHYPVNIGDLYENGSFMNEHDVLDEHGNVLVPARTVIERDMTQEEYIRYLEAKNQQNEVQLAATNADLQALTDYLAELQII